MEDIRSKYTKYIVLPETESQYLGEGIRSGITASVFLSYAGLVRRTRPAGKVPWLHRLGYGSACLMAGTKWVYFTTCMIIWGQLRKERLGRGIGLP